MLKLLLNETRVILTAEMFTETTRYTVQGPLQDNVICLQLPEKRIKDIKMLTAQRNVLCLCKINDVIDFRFQSLNPFWFIVSMV